MRNEAIIKHPIASTLNNIPVYVDLIQSPASEAIAQQPHLVKLVKELLRTTPVSGSAASLEHDFGENIGNSDIVEITEKDTILYAKRIKQNVFTPFVRKRMSRPSSYISVILRKDDTGEYELCDAWIGKLMPPLPGTAGATHASRSYWDTHALIFEGQRIQMRTLTKTCPY